MALDDNNVFEEVEARIRQDPDYIGTLEKLMGPDGEDHAKRVRYSMGEDNPLPTHASAKHEAEQNRRYLVAAQALKDSGFGNLLHQPRDDFSEYAFSGGVDQPNPSALITPRQESSSFRGGQASLALNLVLVAGLAALLYTPPSAREPESPPIPTHYNLE